MTSAKLCDLSVVVPNWNGEGLVERCVASVLEDAARTPELAVEVIVVDNGSTDRCVENLRASFVEVRILRLVTNFGFAYACNRGIEGARGRYVMLLNADAQVVAGCLSSAVRALDAAEDVGLANPMTLWPDGSLQPAVLRLPDFVRAWWEEVFWHTRLHKWLRRSYLRQAWSHGVDYERPVEMEFLRGACLLIRRELIEQVGLLDERFFFGHEETDYCRRARAARWRLLWLGAGSKVVHGGSLVGGRFGPLLRLWKNESKFQYWRKWNGWVAEWALRLTVVGIALAKAVMARALSAARRSRRAQWRERARLETVVALKALSGRVGLPEAEERRLRIGFCPGGGSHQVLARVLEGCEGILDLGCNEGNLEMELSANGVRAAVGLDINREALKCGAARVPWVRLVRADLENGLPFRPGSGRWFAAVVFADVLEHLRNPLSVLSMLSRPASARGLACRRLVTSIPNVGNWRVRRMLLRGCWTYEASGLLDRTHLRFFTRATAEGLLREGGWIPGAMYITPGNKAPTLRGHLSRLLGTWWPALFGYQFVFDCYRAAPDDAI